MNTTMEIVNFVQNNFVASAVAGGILHDNIKSILGSYANSLLLIKNNKEASNTLLIKIIESNENIKKQLESLKSGDIKNITLNNGDYIEGDKINGDKILGNKIVQSEKKK